MPSPWSPSLRPCEPVEDHAAVGRQRADGARAAREDEEADAVARAPLDELARAGLRDEEAVLRREVLGGHRAGGVERDEDVDALRPRLRPLEAEARTRERDDEAGVAEEREREGQMAEAHAPRGAHAGDVRERRARRARRRPRFSRRIRKAIASGTRTRRRRRSGSRNDRPGGTREATKARSPVTRRAPSERRRRRPARGPSALWRASTSWRTARALTERLPRVLARRGALSELDAVRGGEEVGERGFARELEALLAQAPHGLERRPFEDGLARRALEEALHGVRELRVEAARVVAEVLRGGREPREREAQLLARRERGRRGRGGRRSCAAGARRARRRAPRRARRRPPSAIQYFAGHAGMRTGLSAFGASSSGFWPGGRREATVSSTAGGRTSR